jgi:hypothetical protein
MSGITLVLHLYKICLKGDEATFKVVKSRHPIQKVSCGYTN